MEVVVMGNGRERRIEEQQEKEDEGGEKATSCMYIY
jgi:hypothetical protein